MTMERLSNLNEAQQIIILVVLRDVVVISIIIIITGDINIIITIISAIIIIIIIINIIIISVIIIGVNNSVFDRGDRKPNFELDSLCFGIGVPGHNYDSGKLKEGKMASSRLIFQGY